MVRVNIECAACARPVADNAYICHSCGGRLTRNLHRAPMLAAELETTLTRQSRVARSLHPQAEVVEDDVDEGDELTLRKTMLPFDVTASAAASHLRGVLVAWTRLVVDERGSTYPQDRVPAVVGFLLLHVDWIRHHPAASDALAEIAGAVSWAWRVVDLSPEENLIGVCGALTEVGACPYDVYAPKDATSASCRACGATHDDVEARRASLLAGAEDSLLTASELSAGIAAWGATVTTAAVHKWTQRGRLTARGEIDGRKVYRLGDALDLAFGEQARKGMTA